MLEDDLLIGRQLVRRDRGARRSFSRTARRSVPTFQFSQQLPDARVAGGGVLHLGHEGELVGAQIGAVGRQVDLLIPAEQAVHRAEHVDAFEAGDEFRAGGFGCHGTIERRPRRFASDFVHRAAKKAGRAAPGSQQPIN